jgi:hypothetical protein
MSPFPFSLQTNSFKTTCRHRTGFDPFEPGLSISIPGRVSGKRPLPSGHPESSNQKKHSSVPRFGGNSGQRVNLSPAPCSSQSILVVSGALGDPTGVTSRDVFCAENDAVCNLVDFHPIKRFIIKHTAYIDDREFSDPLGTCSHLRRQAPRSGDTAFRLQSVQRSRTLPDLRHFLHRSEIAAFQSPLLTRRTAGVSSRPHPPLRCSANDFIQAKLLQ